MIRELVWFDKLSDSIKTYYDSEAININNVSHWNSTQEFNDELMGVVKLDHCPIDFQYIYDEREHTDNVAKQLNLNRINSKIVITPSGTTSIEMVVNMLASLGLFEVDILAPVYFSVLYSLKRVGCKYNIHHQLSTSKFQLPMSLFNSNFKALWITNPVFSTSIYASNKLEEYIEFLLNSGVVVICDESLCWDGKYIGRKFAGKPGFIGIYNPLKKITLNSIKFSAICCEDNLETHLLHWADIIYGGLSQSNKTALSFFTSDSYVDSVKLSEKYFLNSYERIAALLQPFPDVEIDTFDNALYISCYIRNKGFKDLGDFNQCWDIMKRARCAFIPNNRNHFSLEDSLSFRINLSRMSPQTLGDIARLLFLLSSFSTKKRQPLKALRLEIQEVTNENWQSSMAIQLSEGQSEFVWTVLESLARAFIQPNGKEILPYAIKINKKIKAFFFTEIETELSSEILIGGFQLDNAYQGQGNSKKVLNKVHLFLRSKYPLCSRFRVLINSQNIVSQNLFKGMGYKSSGKWFEDEEEYFFKIEKEGAV